MLKTRAGSPLQAVASLVSVVLLEVITLQTPEILKQARRSIGPSLHTLKTSFFESLLSIASVLLLLTTVPSPRSALIFLFSPQANGAGIDTEFHSAQLFLSSSTSMPRIVAIFTRKRARRLSLWSQASTSLREELRRVTSCSITRK